ncbi:MAG TPA: Mpv17/PMP22 family protein, partial [bacterium]|nr:Mpv17/PMP22 family protein [bacterium]
LKTIPLFWIPAHTITFLLPENHRVLFAAILGVVLGVFLAIASLKGKK